MFMIVDYAGCISSSIVFYMNPLRVNNRTKMDDPLWVTPQLYCFVSLLL